VAVAVNCCVPPVAKLAAFGVTAIEVTTDDAVATVSAAVPFTPLSDAVIVVDPTATPLARPPLLIVAVAVPEDVQVTVEVTTAVVPLL
jgi:hypothetical protein